MALQIDTLSQTNRLKKLPASHKLSFGILTLIIAFTSHNLVQIAIILWLGIWTVIYAKIPAKIYLKMIAGAAIFLMMSLPAIIINITNTAEIAAILDDKLLGITIGHWYFYISYTGTLTAAAIFLRSLAGISCLFFILLTVPFGEILQILRRLGCPVLLTELLLLMYRFIFIFLQTASDIWLAQNARNGYQSWWGSLRSLSLLIGQLLHSVLERYRQLSLSLNSRGFTGEFQVWQPQKKQHSWRYLLESVMGCGVLLVVEWMMGKS